MTRFRFSIGLAAVFLAILAGVFIWQHPGVTGARLTPAEVDTYLKRAEAQITMPAEEKADMLARVRTWALQDDGKPVFMLNLMRYYPQVRQLPGGPPAATPPRQANASYESLTAPMLLKIGGSVPFSGDVQGDNLLNYDARGDHWSRTLVIRYPSRRAFLTLLSDPAYPAVLPYKLAALEIILSPSNSELVMPDLTQTTAVILLLAFLAIGWIGAAIRVRTLEKAVKLEAAGEAGR